MPNIEFNKNTWFGVGAKSGFMLLGLGYERTDGIVMNLHNHSRLNGFKANGLRLGLGLGCSTGVAILCVFNCPNIYALNGGPKGDWGINISLGGNWDDIAKALGKVSFYKSALRIGKGMNISNKKDVENVRLGLHYMYNGLDVGKSGNSSPKYLCLESGVGLGAELSGFYSVSHFYIN